MVRILLVRHGESVGNKNGIFTGQMDLPLTEEGISQAVRRVERIAS